MLTGYRRYKLRSNYTDRNNYALAGVHAEWDSREMQAECDLRRGRSFLYDMTAKEECAYHLSMDYLPYDCSCGIYVPKGPDMIPDYHSYPAIVAVSAWGNYIEYEYGYRVQFVRMEHIWIEPSWVEELTHEEDDVDKILENLSKRYGVEAEIRKSAICCGQDHEMGYWPSAGGPILICKMETSHIVNCLKYMKRTSSRAEWIWKGRFERELKRRAPQKVDGKMMVTF